MTAVNTSIVEDPYYRGLVTKIQGMGDVQRAALRTMVDSATATAGGEAIKKYLTLAEMGSRKSIAERSLALKEKRTDLLYGPGGVYPRKLAIQEETESKALAQGENIAERSLALKGQIAMDNVSIARRNLENEGDQLVPTLIGIGNVGAGLIGGIVDYQEKKELASLLRKRGAEISGIYKGLKT